MFQHIKSICLPAAETTSSDPSVLSDSDAQPSEASPNHMTHRGVMSHLNMIKRRRWFATDTHTHTHISSSVSICALITPIDCSDVLVRIGGTTASQVERRAARGLEEGAPIDAADEGLHCIAKSAPHTTHTHTNTHTPSLPPPPRRLHQKKKRQTGCSFQ